MPDGLRAEFAESLRAAKALVATAGDNTAPCMAVRGALSPIVHDVDRVSQQAGIMRVPDATPSGASAGPLPAAATGEVAAAGDAGDWGVPQVVRRGAMHATGGGGVRPPAQQSARVLLWQSISAVRDDLALL